jgi:hypothetical protein
MYWPVTQLDPVSTFTIYFTNSCFKMALIFFPCFPICFLLICNVKILYFTVTLCVCEICLFYSVTTIGNTHIFINITALHITKKNSANTGKGAEYKQTDTGECKSEISDDGLMRRSVL